MLGKRSIKHSLFENGTDILRHTEPVPRACMLTLTVSGLADFGGVRLGRMSRFVSRRLGMANLILRLSISSFSRYPSLAKY
jgi:hypothetical protein